MNMSEMVAPALPLERISAYCRTQPIVRLSMLGPGFKDWLRPDTDCGMLVEYHPEVPITYIDMARQERELAGIVGSVVDLRTPNELESTSKHEILAGATLVFAKDAGK